MSDKLKKLREGLISEKKGAGRPRILSSKAWRTKNDTDITILLDTPKRFAYLKSTEWAAKKKWWWSIYFKNNKTAKCELCHCSNSALQLHHHTYKRYYGNERYDDLVQLCHDCHVVLHGYVKLFGFLQGKGGGNNLWNLSHKFINSAKKLKDPKSKLPPWQKSSIKMVVEHPKIQAKLNNKKWIYPY